MFVFIKFVNTISKNMKTQLQFLLVGAILFSFAFSGCSLFRSEHYSYLNKVLANSSSIQVLDNYELLKKTQLPETVVEVEGEYEIAGVQSDTTTILEKAKALVQNPAIQSLFAGEMHFTPKMFQNAQIAAKDAQSDKGNLWGLIALILLMIVLIYVVALLTKNCLVVALIIVLMAIVITLAFTA